MTDLIELFKMLSDETRLRILVLLFNKELCVCEICDILEESQPKVSRHLAKLRHLNFVIVKRQGQWIFYYLNIQEEFMGTIIQCIVNNLRFCPLIKADMEKLHKRLSENRMCNREN